MKLSNSNKTALVFGASGLVGSQLLQILLHHPNYKKVRCFGRSMLLAEHEKLEQVEFDFDDPTKKADLIKGEDLFYTLGTTMAKAGSRKVFMKVDFTYGKEIFSLAETNGVNQVFLVSAAGAHPDSIFFYNRVKGALEYYLKKLNFWSIHIFRPGMLIGDRKEDRPLEKIGGRISTAIGRIGPINLGKWESVDVKVVAQAMVNCAQELKDGIFTHNANTLKQIANSRDKFPDKRDN